MAEMLRTGEMAKRLGITQENLTQTACKYGIPCYKEWFPPLSGRGKKQIGWNPVQVMAWYKKSGRMNDAGELINLRTGQPRRCNGQKVKASAAPIKECPKGRATPGEVKLGLAHLLGAFAFACQNGGIPHELQELLEAADLEKLDPVALDIIEEMAIKHPKTEAQWILIKEALPTLIRRAKAADPGLPIKITIQAGPDHAHQINLKVIGYNTPAPAKQPQVNAHPGRTGRRR